MHVQQVSQFVSLLLLFFFSYCHHKLRNTKDILYELPFPKWQILDASKLKEFADDSFKFAGNGSKFSKRVENTEGKGEIARIKQFLLFLQCFQKTHTADM